ncbi:hypothetical protein [Microbacterium foliorum]|uniref:hypothetical protein n=1 Tax=Microbacterium foliorum TaxID=104336 RepID=UPI00286CF617|nr:hypothetical protein [Microbacterium foliorum]
MPNLLVIALVIGDLTGEPISLADMFRGGEHFAPPNETDAEGVTADWLCGVLAGAVVQLPPPRARADKVDKVALWSAFVEETMLEEEIQSRLSARGAHPLTPAERDGQFEAMLEESQDSERRRHGGNATPSLAVKRAATKLGVAALDVERRAVALWGRRFESELWSRAGGDSSPQARGRVTRLLVEEIRESLGEH